MAENSNLSSSATNSPIRVSEYLPHLLHFTLSQAVRDTPEFSSPLPLDFCAKLLQSEPQNACCCFQYHQFKQESNCCDCVCHADDTVAVREGVPVYPLYKQIASTLSESITSGTFVRENASMPGLHKDEMLNLKMDEWIKMIVKMGSHLIDLLQRAKFHLDVQEPFFTQLKNGQKTVEGRCALGNYKRILPGDLLLVNWCLLLTVQAVNWYNSFYQMIEAESIEKVLPGIKTIKEGVLVYRQFYSEEKEKSGGVLAIVVVRAPLQPYIILSDMLRELNVEGLSILLGLRSTTGTIPDAVPPPRSTLMSSFSSLNRENGTGNKLTVGARALAKHVHRSSDGWWGPFTGKEVEKNNFARDIVSHIISHAQWMNIYHVHPNKCIFETRTKEGYGARWSRNGTKFIGFLEPLMKDGHSKRWRH